MFVDDNIDCSTCVSSSSVILNSEVIREIEAINEVKESSVLSDELSVQESEI